MTAAPPLPMRIARCAAAGLACLLLSGCIAAAIPLAAGAVMVEGRDGRRATGEVASGSAVEAAPRPAIASVRSDMRFEATTLVALPPPAFARPVGDSAILGLRTYALGLADARRGAGTRPSAILTGASSLQVLRSDCGPLPAAVFVDLDPSRETFDPLAPGESAPGLADALAALRTEGIRVVWFSRLGANFAAAARAALAQSGLDPEGVDELALLDDLSERKQSVRDAVARRLCPIAMLGDHRSDFDELYFYLKDPDAAVALDTMIGDGWFLASPFAPPVTPAITPTGTTPVTPLPTEPLP